MFKELTTPFSFREWYSEIPSVMPYPHFHHHYEIYVLLEGLKIYDIGTEHVTLRGPSMLLVAPETLHRARSVDHSPQRIALITFSPDFLKRLQPSAGFALLDTPFSYLHLPLVDADIIAPFRDVTDETLQLCRLYDLFCTLTARRGELAFGNPAEGQAEKLTEIVKYICAHLDEKLSLAALAARFGYSYSYLSELLSQHLGMSFSEYLAHLRLNRAKEMLRRGTSVRETAAACGFDTPNYFGDFFRRRTGMSPSEFAENPKYSVELTGLLG